MNRYGNLGGNGKAPRIAFYTRISTDEDHQKYSLGAQSERLEAFCKAQYGDDWRLHKIYRDTESGTHMNRPGLEEMLYDAEAQTFDVLLVFRVDRLSRKVRELAQMVDELTKYGIILKSITEPFDTANAAGKMMLQMLGVFAEFEHATIVERTKVGMEKKAKGGEFVGGNVPYGFTLDPEKGLLINEEEALIVRKMFQMYAFGREGVHTICHKMNDAGHRKRSGKKWDKRVILHMIKNPTYVGKIRWREVLYNGNHDAIVSEILFDKAQALLKDRVESLSGRRFENCDERLLAGLIQCARCKGHMVGVTTHKKERRYPYYLCNKRWNTHDCDQDYVRANLLESAIIQDIKTMYRDERFIARVWEEANKLVGKEKPTLEKEIARTADQAARIQARIDRYFEAFETGSMKPDICNQKVQDLKAQVRELEAEKQELDARRERLELPPIDRKMLSRLVDEFEETMEKGTNQKKKHLLRQLVKKVLIHDRRTVEVWYGLPNRASVSTPGHLAPHMCRSTNRQAEPEAYFRIVYGTQNGHNGVHVAAYHEQTVEITLGPKGAFENGNIGALTRRVATDRVVYATPPPRSNSKPRKEPRTPRVVELLRKAIEWQALLESGQIANQAEIAHREGITRARVTQVMGMLRLSPRIQGQILSMPDGVHRSPVTERMLRPIIAIPVCRDQLREFHKRSV